jgi:hypothetical protein
MIFCREVPVCSVLDAAYREQHISKWNYEITVLQEINISSLELQRWPLEFFYFISFQVFGIWDRGFENLQSLL